MFRALRIGLTGLRVNQRYLDVIGNNLTNAETAGFKADRLTFSDVLYDSQRAPSGPSASLGGVNGRQFGFGTQVASVDQIQKQGSLLDTGRTFDLALQGKGFFVVSNGSEDFYTRVGSLTIDRNSSLVDSRTGFLVKNAAGAPISIDSESVAPAVATSNVTFGGNLPAVKTGPLAEIQESSNPYLEVQPAVLTGTVVAPGSGAGETLTLNLDSAAPVQIPLTGVTLTDVATDINNYFIANPSSPSVTASVNGAGALVLTSSTQGKDSKITVTGTNTLLADIGLSATPTANGTEAAATAATLLNDLSANSTNYANGDIIQITGIDTQGNSVNASFVVGPQASGFSGETLGELVTAIQTQFPGTTVNLDANGAVQIQSNTTGVSPLTVSLQDLTSSNTGSTSFSAHTFDPSQEGTGPDTKATSITVIDSLGITHTLSGQFERQDDDTWNLTLSVPNGEGALTGSPVTQIAFGSNGAFQGSSLPQIDVTWASGASIQSINLDFGTVGGLKGLTQFGKESGAQATSQNGFEAGSLTNLGVTSSGVIQGFYSNGAIVDLDTLAVAQFANDAGLIREGSTLYRRSDNSGTPLIGQAGVAGAANLVSGALEGSNVDTAEEFVRLIEAQRSFQGAARIVTTADEMFQELLQIL